jgi:hypothetical protein
VFCHRIGSARGHLFVDFMYVVFNFFFFKIFFGQAYRKFVVLIFL